MTKSLQTMLLLVTGLTGYMSSRCPVFNWFTIIQLSGSLFLAIAGSAIINMWYDRDIDAKMSRTCQRPLPSRRIHPNEALILGVILSVLGIGWALTIDRVFGWIVFAGLFFDVFIYTMWLKRRTSWSIVWGGMAGAMPILAGRALGVGYIDWIGVLLAFSVLFWIPTHILTFSIRYKEDYHRAGIPTFSSAFGDSTTQRIIAISSVLAAIAMGTAAIGISITFGYLRLMGVLSGGLLLLAISSLVKPSDFLNFGLFKYASLYMLSAMILLTLGIL